VSKRSKPVIPPLQIDPAQEKATRDLMARMRQPAGVHQEPSADSRGGQQGGSPPAEIADSRASDVGVNTPTLARLVGVSTPTNKTGGSPRAGGAGVRRSDRHPAEHAKLNTWQPRTLIKEFKEFALRHGLTLTEFIALAGVHFMECAGVRREENVGVNTPHDELMMFMTHDDIIRLYQGVTGNKWKPADDRVARRYNETDRRLIEIGILSAAIRTKAKRINSFAYFKDEIDLSVEGAKEAKLGDESIEDILRGRRNIWERKRTGQLV
jgi:hypothetical protein